MKKIKSLPTILGIETSCDETTAAVYREDDGVLANTLFSQINLHKKFGGVFPEIAAQSHLEKIDLVVSSALKTANISLDDIDSIAVTNNPGLSGSLLVGLSFAKAIAWARTIPLIGINHLEGHIFSTSLEHSVPFPYLCLTASGGHTSLYIVHNFGNFKCIGKTLDDAAGEAFDKIARLIGLSYPGGPEIERLASQINYKDFFHYPRGRKNTVNFSFSGLKTAVLYDLVNRNAYDMEKRKFLKENDQIFQQQVASSLLVCISDIFKKKLLLALQQYPKVKVISFVGGVACNNYIKQQLQLICKQHQLQLFTPSPEYCTDNAAMIAFVGNYKAKQGKISNLDLDIFE